jgi:ParB/RepB/Spo0J family partition protein
MRMELELHQIDRRYEALRIADAAHEARLAASLATDGQHHPVLVVVDATGQYVLIDGYRRVRALATLGHDTVTVLVLPCDETTARILGHRLAHGRRHEALEEGWLLAELVEMRGVSARRIAAELGRTTSWVSRRLALAKALPLTVQAHVRRGSIGPHAAAKYLVPMARANTEHCRRLVEAIAAERLTPRQIAVLYTAWRGGDAEVRERIVGAPLLYLRAHAAATLPSARCTDAPTTRWLGDLERLAAACWRTRTRMREVLARDPDLAARDRCVTSWRHAQSAFDALTATMEEALGVGPGHADGRAAAVG